LATLFFTEMWERFSYYGMRALLILFMTASVADGGLGFDVAKAGIIYGLYTAMVYLMSLPGGWLADTFIGQRRAVVYGGILIAGGQFCLATPSMASFYLGLALVVLGTGLLKPNVSTIVGQLYSPTDNRRDAGFSIFYMGINIGAFLAPLICGYLGQRVNWRLGFAAAGVGMLLGLVQYAFGGKYLGEAGAHPAPLRSPADAAQRRKYLTYGIVVTVLLLGIPALLAVTGAITLTAEGISQGVAVVLISVVVAVFGWLLFGGDWTTEERKRFLAILALFLASVLFWSAFEQGGSTLNLFAQRSTDKDLFGLSIPASWFQSLNAIFIVALAPVIAWLWVWLGSKEPSSPAKFSLGLIFVGGGFVVMALAAMRAASVGQVGAGWLTLTYLLHTIGELCLSPVGLSAMSKLAPARVAGFIMGVWFLSISVANYVGGLLAAVYETFTPETLFTIVAGYCIALGLVLALLVKPIRGLMGGVK
jgi:POT family proton-dependent oligopeptide transporter